MADVQGIGNCCCSPPHPVCWTYYSCYPYLTRRMADVHVVVKGPSPSTDIVCEGDTDANGQFCCSLEPGTYTRESSHPSGRYADRSDVVVSPGGGSVVMAAATGYTCCPTGCFDPIANTLYATGNAGTFELNVCTTIPGAAHWIGCGPYDPGPRVVLDSYGHCSVEESGPIDLPWIFTCGRLFVFPILGYWNVPGLGCALIPANQWCPGYPPECETSPSLCGHPRRIWIGDPDSFGSPCDAATICSILEAFLSTFPLANAIGATSSNALCPDAWTFPELRASFYDDPLVCVDFAFTDITVTE